MLKFEDFVVGKTYHFTEPIRMCGYVVYDFVYRGDRFYYDDSPDIYLKDMMMFVPINSNKYITQLYLDDTLIEEKPLRVGIRPKDITMYDIVPI